MKNFKVWACIVMLTLTSLGVAQQAGDLASAGFDPANMDSTCKACDDFNQYANGGWLKRTEIPGDKARWGAFDELGENNWRRIRGILEEAAANPGAPGTISQKVGDSGLSFAGHGGQNRTVGHWEPHSCQCRVGE